MDDSTSTPRVRIKRRSSVLQKILRSRKSLSVADISPPIPSRPSMPGIVSPVVPRASLTRLSAASSSAGMALKGDDKIWNTMRSKGLVLKGHPNSLEFEQASHIGKGKERSPCPSDLQSLRIETEIFSGESLYTPSEAAIPSPSSFKPTPSSSRFLHPESTPKSAFSDTSSIRQSSNASFLASSRRTSASSASFPCSPNVLCSTDDLSTTTACTTPAITPRADIGLGVSYFSPKLPNIEVEALEAEEEPADLLWAHLETQLGQGLYTPAVSRKGSDESRAPSLARSGRLDSEVAMAHQRLRQDRSIDEGELDAVVLQALLNESTRMGEDEVNHVLAQEEQKRSILQYRSRRPDPVFIFDFNMKDEQGGWKESYVPALDLILDWTIECPSLEVPKSRPVSGTISPKSSLPRSTSGNLAPLSSRLPVSPSSRLPVTPRRAPSADSTPARSPAWHTSSTPIASKAASVDSKLPRPATTSTPRASITSLPGSLSSPAKTAQAGLASWFGFRG